MSTLSPSHHGGRFQEGFNRLLEGWAKGDKGGGQTGFSEKFDVCHQCVAVFDGGDHVFPGNLVFFGQTKLCMLRNAFLRSPLG